MSEEVVNYSALSANELESAESTAVAAFNELADKEDIGAEQLAELTALAESVNAVRAEKAVRLTNASDVAALRNMINPGPEDDDDADDGIDDIEGVTASDPGELVTASVTADVPKKVDVRDVVKSGNNLNASLRASLAAASQHSPKVPAVVQPRAESVMVASSEIPGYAQGSRLATMRDLVGAMHARARALPDRSPEVPVASLMRDFKFNLNDRSTPADIEQVFDAMLDTEVLTAAGGWCAPSQISYDFYNIVCEDGILDLPTVGITRGGLQFPTSPSFGDVAGQIWTWTETQDIAAVTGTAQSGTKPCYRVACPAYNNVRLECDGLCLTMGNLMNDAFPELVANQLRLLFAAKAHYTNARIIQQLVAGSTAVTYATPTGHGLAAPVLEAVEMQVIDYRIKYRMCNDAILEVVFPTWIMPMFRADLAKRLGIAEFDVPDSRIIRWFNDRGVRVQLIQDWQVGTTGLPGQATAITAWPTTVSFLLYAAGTWIRGNGMRLDLGVIRDSVLNTTNDFTLAWMEDCYLTAKIGHESRLVTLPICPNGATQAGITMSCSL